MKRFALTLLLVISTSTGHAAPAWLIERIKVINPNEVGLFVFASNDCFLTEEKVTQISKDVVIRSRIKPIVNKFTGDKNLFLEVDVLCIKPQEGSAYAMFDIDVRFGFSEKNLNYTGYNFGTIGSGPESFISSIIKESVEDAMTAFVISNFDLQ